MFFGGLRAFFCKNVSLSLRYLMKIKDRTSVNITVWYEVDTSMKIKILVFCFVANCSYTCDYKRCTARLNVRQQGILPQKSINKTTYNPNKLIKQQIFKTVNLLKLKDMPTKLGLRPALFPWNFVCVNLHLIASSGGRINNQLMSFKCGLLKVR